MKNLKLTGFLFLLAFILCLSIPSCKRNKSLKLDITPTELYEKMISNPAFVQNPNGENFCWQARVGMDQYISNYELTRDPGWLDAGVKYYDFLIGKMIPDPDGYKGWIGEYGYDAKYWQDALVGDAILMAGILDFCILVLENDTLKSTYGDKANSYVAIAKKDFIEKWDKRGCWIDDSPYGSYIGFSKYLKPDNLKEWIYDPKVLRSGVSHPFNKQMDVAEVCLQIHRITGEKFYWDRAESIYFTAKSHFQYFNDHYCWNYFEPLYPGDVDLKMKETLHGVWVHPWRSGYQAGEVGQIIRAYHYGIVFDSVDIKRIINTNLNVMWNKDKLNPKFISSNGLGGDGDTLGLAAFQRAYGHSNVTKNAGELWTGLLDFDQTIRDLYELRFRGNKKSPRYLSYKNNVLVNPSGFKRKYVKGNVTVPVINFTECKDLYLATVLPHKVPKDGKSIIICKSWNPRDLQIDLYSLTGEKLTNLYKGKIIKERTFVMTWDGKDPVIKAKKYKGEFKIRWTTSTGYREFPVVID